jgi:uridylate kinase
MPTGSIQYRRILLKLSGEVLQNREKGLSIDPDVLRRVAERVRAVTSLGAQMALVVGGGNIFRGISGEAGGIDRTSGDYMGMLATIINGIALQNAIERIGIQTRVMTAIEMDKVAEPFILRRALRHLDKGRVLIFDGVYAADPKIDPTAARFDVLSYGEALQRNLRVMDGAAFSLCRENHIPIIVFNFFHEGVMERIVRGERVGTLVNGDGVLPAT